ncbi:hypothetical protein [Pseudogulbenkiania subflava]|uniref:Type II and III secretion system protein n=1 Tax=Pseudogulbenkiania subflava DSM 22618 TaxID=1123014 RepID=A0A1Y6CDC0_9NEIS|nr:hypothetical protein [Pseudogulbenkiania subflava]SMF46962.1 hypothetical protein SAMN02745746_03466 [Pseudogulbenkiania subflava DSM 22618]
MKYALYAALWLASANVMALEVIDLGWRDGREVADAIAPHLQPGESASGLGRQLILDASPARLATLRSLARTLDVRPSNLLIEVEQNGDSRQSSSTLSLGGAARIGNVELDLGRRRGDLALDADATQSRGSRHSRQTLRLLDGGSGFIESGSSRPLPWLLVTPQGGIVRGAEYQDAVTGFYVRPRRNGNRVVVELAARQEAFGAGGIEQSRLSTTVTGAVGEWMQIGSVGLDEQGRQVMLLGVSQYLRSVERIVRIRVLADN